MAFWTGSRQQVIRTDAQQRIALNIVVGIVGGALARFVLSPLLGIPINAVNFLIGGLLISFLGALIFWPSSIPFAVAECT